MRGLRGVVAVVLVAGSTVGLAGCGGNAAVEVCDELVRALKVAGISEADREEAYMRFLLAQKAALELPDGDPLKEAVLAAGDGESVSPFAVGVIVEDHC